jgi:hypothetical protein
LATIINAGFILLGCKALREILMQVSGNPETGPWGLGATGVSVTG